MRTTLILAALATIAAPSLAQTPVRIGSDSYVSRMAYTALKTPEGRAQLMQALQQSATRLCNGVQPRVDAIACERGVMARAEATAIPQVGEAIRLARTEQQGTAFAAVR